MTTSSGAVAERYAFTAYGQPTICNASGSPIGNQQSQIANGFTYTGRQWDETLGLNHFRARWLSPLAGSFLGRDPMGYVDGWNIYLTRFSVSGVDPHGLYNSNPSSPFNQTGANCERYSLDLSGKMANFFKAVDMFKLKGMTTGLLTFRGSFEFYGSGTYEKCKMSCCDGTSSYTESEIFNGGGRGKVSFTFGFDIDEVYYGNGFKAWGGVRGEGRLGLDVSWERKANHCTGVTSSRLCWGIVGTGSVRGGLESKIVINYVEFYLATVEAVGECTGSALVCAENWHEANPKLGANCIAYFRICKCGICYRRDLF
jgi:RHS repeat-associated protein